MDHLLPLELDFFEPLVILVIVSRFIRVIVYCLIALVRDKESNIVGRLGHKKYIYVITNVVHKW